VSLLPLEDAVAHVLAHALPMADERVPLREAAGRFLAGEIVAPRDLPSTDISMMDGYALRAADAQGEAPLRVAFEMAAGSTPGRELRSGEAARIFTGAPVPQGADCVVMQEHARRDGERVVVVAAQAPRAGQHIRRRGEEVRRRRGAAARHRAGPRRAVAGRSLQRRAAAGVRQAAGGHPGDG
jgi:molybdopterin molybdotransferase